MTREDFRAFERVLEEGLADDSYTCVVAAVGSSEREQYRCAFGVADPDSGQRVTTETVFDMASVTKAVVTTTIVLRLVEEGRLALTDTVGRHLPAVEGERGAITISQLLTHTSGLQPYHFSEEWSGPTDARAAVLRDDLLNRSPGEHHEYSCLNFAHLAFIVEEVTGETLPTLAEEYVFDAVGMETASIGEPVKSAASIAVTRDHEYGRGEICGEIHDPLAYAMKGRSGNAGLFATVDDVSRFARTFLTDALSGSNQLLAAPTIDRLATDMTPDGVDAHGLGWRLADHYLPAPTWTTASIGHTGYTGTSLWIDLERDHYCTILTNDVYTGKEDTDVPRVRELAHATVGAVPR